MQSIMKLRVLMEDHNDLADLVKLQVDGNKVK
jgi:hypothetical protein